MKIIYVAHPIAGDVDGNILKIIDIIKGINLEYDDICPLAHYVLDCLALNDEVSSQRERGILNDQTILASGIIKEVWLYGPTISSGMRAEVDLAHSLGIKVKSMTLGTKDMYKTLYGHQSK